MPLWLRPDALPGATLPASPLNAHFLFQGCQDTGISSFFFRVAELPLVIPRLSVRLLPDQTSTSCSGYLGSYMSRPLTLSICVTRRASWELSAPPPGCLCKLQLPAVCGAARDRGRGAVVGLPGGLELERRPC